MGVAALSLLLLGVADTGRGRIFALAALVAAVLPLVGSIAFAVRTRHWLVCFTGGAALWLIAVGLVLNGAPKGGNSDQARLSHQYFPDHRSFPRYSLGNLLPESDQLRLGFTLMAFIDPILTRGSAAELKRLTATVYRELEDDADFHAVGSNMGAVYTELFGLSAAGHSYVYVPAGVDRTRPRPVLVFFHGSGGNFKGYLWVLSKLADRLGFILAAPSNGPGNWRETQSVEGLREALDAVSRVAVADRSHVHVMGLSNGGLAISQLAALQGSQFESMIFLSPVFDTPALRSASFATQCRDQRVLVLTGARDDRVPLDYVEANAAFMTRTGVRVQMQTVESADHFLIFSHREQLVRTLAEWLAPAR